MTAQFLLDPRADLSALPRKLRVAIRQEHFLPAKPRIVPQTKTNEDSDQIINGWDAISDPYGDGHQYNCNTVDPDFDLDSSSEFDDDCTGDDFEAHAVRCGLTIVEPGHGNIRRWLRGRDVI